MSGSNRDGGSAVLSLAAASVLAFMCAIAFMIVSEQYARLHEVFSDYQRTADGDRRKAADKAGRACFNSAPEDRVRCISDEVLAYERQQSLNKELQAQQDMAFWARWSFFAGLATVIVTGCGLIYVRETLEANRRAVSAAEKAILIENRPWLRLEPKIASDFAIHKSGASIHCLCVYTNVGKGPAHRVMVSVGNLDFGSRTLAADMQRWISEQLSLYETEFVADETIFPDDVFGDQVVASCSQESMDRVPLFGKRKALISVFIFGVFYRSTINDDILYTVAAYKFGEKNEHGGLRAIFLDERTSIPSSSIHLERYEGLSRAV